MNDDINKDDLDGDELQDEITRIEFEMNALSSGGEIRTDFIENTNATNINKIVKSLEVAHKTSKKHTKILTLEHLNITSLYNKSIKQDRIMIGMGIVIALLTIKIFVF